MKHIPVGIFFFSLFCYTWFLTPNVNSGDAGELITASHFLGNAHPSGYPLYLILGKLLEFIPLGNLGFKLAILSSIFGSLTLCCLYILTYSYCNNVWASMFAVITLWTSYSFFTHSVIAKFYTLNAFIIMLIIYLATKILNEKSDLRTRLNYLCLVLFLLGLGTGNHHTIIVILPALMVVIFVLRQDLTIRILVKAACAFSLGFIINLYIFIRGTETNFFNSVYVRDIYDAVRVFLRSDYKEGATINACKSIFSQTGNYIFTLKNFGFILLKNFNLFTCFLCFAGIVSMLIKNKKVGIFLISCLFLYGPLLAKMTIGHTAPTETDYYIAAHQYFLPALCISSIFVGIGLALIASIIKRLNFHFLSRTLLPLLCTLPLINLISRSIDSNYRTNFIPYQVAKESFSLLPINSVLLTYGDNPIYQGWYLKLVGRYREDICQLSASEQESPIFSYQGCSQRIYATSHAQVYMGKISEMDPVMKNGRFFTSDPLHDLFFFKDYLQGHTISLVTGLTKRATDNEAAHSENSDPFENIHGLSDKILNPIPCLEHKTDDLYTRALCSKYVTYLVVSSKRFSHENYGKLGKEVTLSMPLMHNNIKKGELVEKVDVTKYNARRLALASKIADFNNWNILYMR